VLLKIDILHCQQKKTVNKVGQRLHHDVYYVATAVGEKARLRTKRAMLSSEEIKPVALPLLRYAWLKASVS